MNREEAIKILKLSPLALAPLDIERAYLKLIRRFPPELFPQKITLIREAYTYLKEGDDFWNQFIADETLDFSFLSPHLKKTPAGLDRKEQQEGGDQLASPEEFLRKISAPILSEIIMLDEGFSDIF